MHIHIANIAERPEPVTNGVLGISGIDKVFLLSSKKYENVANETKSKLELMGCKCEIRKVGGFDFQEIIDRITEIYEETYDKDVRYSINITGGNNLMAAAACFCTPITGAKLYYVLYDKDNPDQPLSERILEVPVPKIRNVERFTKNERLVLKYLREKGGGRNVDVAKGIGMSPQQCGKYIKSLEAEGLIEVVKSHEDKDKKKVDNRSHTVTLSKQGRVVAGWF